MPQPARERRRLLRPRLSRPSLTLHFLGRALTLNALRVFGDAAPPAARVLATVPAVIDTYLDVAATQLAPRTLEEARRILAQFSHSYPRSEPTALRPADLVLWVNACRDWRSDWTRRRVMATVRRPFRWAYRLRLIDRDPFDGISHPPGSRGRPITADELRKILEAADETFRRVLVFLMLTGARPGEMAALEWAFVDIERGAAILTEHKTARSRKDRAPRTIPLGLEIRGILAAMRRAAPTARFVFVNSKGEPWTRNALGLRIARIRKRAGLAAEVKLYGLRHRFGTQACLAGIDLKTISELMGHTSTRMTEHYLHLAGRIDHLHAALERVFPSQK